MLGNDAHYAAGRCWGLLANIRRADVGVVPDRCGCIVDIRSATNKEITYDGEPAVRVGERGQRGLTAKV